MPMVPAHINQHTPMALEHRYMACGEYDILSTMNPQPNPMGGVLKCHGTGVTVHGTCIH
jgi:hypothetical protein